MRVKMKPPRESRGWEKQSENKTLEITGIQGAKDEEKPMNETVKYQPGIYKENQENKVAKEVYVYLLAKLFL